MDINFEANLAYLWFTTAKDTYVDYTKGIEGGIAYPIRRMSNDEVVGIFIEDLDAALEHGKKLLESERKTEATLLLLTHTEWAQQDLAAAVAP